MTIRIVRCGFCQMPSPDLYYDTEEDEEFPEWYHPVCKRLLDQGANPNFEGRRPEAVTEVAHDPEPDGDTDYDDWEPQDRCECEDCVAHRARNARALEAAAPELNWLRNLVQDPRTGVTLTREAVDAIRRVDGRE